MFLENTVMREPVMCRTNTELIKMAYLMVGIINTNEDAALVPAGTSSVKCT